MIESNLHIRTSNQDKYKTGYYTGLGMIIGSGVGATASSVANISEDSFVKAEKNLFEKAVPKSGNKEKWVELVKDTVKSKRANKWELIGALAGAVVAGIVLGVSDAKSKKSE